MNSKKNLYIVLGVVILTIIALVLMRGGGNFSLSGGELPKELTEELGEAKTYENKENNFAFSYPEKLKITEMAIEGIEGGKRILAESRETPGKGFEVIILPFGEDLISKERILQDVPDIVIKNEKDVKVSGDVDALAFESEDENIGATHEIWFVHDGFLYQARTYSDFGGYMEEILKQWRFK